MDNPAGLHAPVPGSAHADSLLKVAQPPGFLKCDLRLPHQKGGNVGCALPTSDRALQLPALALDLLLGFRRLLREAAVVSQVAQVAGAGCPAARRAEDGP